MDIYVGNLPYSTTEDELRDLFVEFGEVVRVNIITDRDTGQSKGFAFIEMPTQSEAEAAVGALNESNLKGRTLRVNEARPRQPRPARGPV